MWLVIYGIFPPKRHVVETRCLHGRHNRIKDRQIEIKPVLISHWHKRHLQRHLQNCQYNRRVPSTSSTIFYLIEFGWCTPPGYNSWQCNKSQWYWILLLRCQSRFLFVKEVLVYVRRSWCDEGTYLMLRNCYNRSLIKLKVCSLLLRNMLYLFTER